MENTQITINQNYFQPIAEKFTKASGLKREDFEKEVSFALQLINNNKNVIINFYLFH